MFSNCYKYNPPDHDVVSMARNLQVIKSSSSQNQLSKSEQMTSASFPFLHILCINGQ